MIWLTWRQFRSQLAATLAALAAVAVVVAVTGPHLAHLFSTEIAGCLGHGGGCDTTTQATFTRTYGVLQHLLGYALLVVPALIGTFWGAPLLTRELEAGTHQFVWSQSVSRTRWLAVKLGIIGLATAAGSGLLSLMVTWWSHPLDRVNADRITPPVFDERGIDPIAWALFGFALGVTVGVLLRRTLPAMATTLAVFAAVRILWPLYVRQHLIPPVHRSTSITSVPHDWVGVTAGPSSPMLVHVSIPGAWVLTDHTVNAAGRQVLGTAGFTSCQPTSTKTGAKQAPDSCFIHHLVQLGYDRAVYSYQPGSRFWALQSVEFGILAVLAALMVAFCFWWVGRGKVS